MEALGFYIKPVDGERYFIQSPQHLRNPDHSGTLRLVIEMVEFAAGGLQSFAGGGVDIWPVYTHADCPLYVVLEDMLEGLGIFATRWSPESPVPIEHDHLRRCRFAVVDFAATEQDAMHIVKQKQSKGVFYVSQYSSV